jgi:putative glutathione S-transferase
MLDKLETRLADGRHFLFGDNLTETDIRAFVTLVRFDSAYYGLFKCNRNLIMQTPYLSRYLAKILAIDGIADTVNLQHIKHGCYSIKALNPAGIAPLGPEVIV